MNEKENPRNPKQGPPEDLESLTEKLAPNVLLTIIDYLDGRLEDEDMVQLEIQLTNQPDLAVVFESFARMDHVQRVALAARTSTNRRIGARLLRSRTFWLPVATAAAIVLLFTVVRITRRTEVLTVESQVAVLASGPTLEEYNTLLDLQPDFLPPGFGLRGPEDDVVPPREYLSAVRNAEARKVGKEFSSPQAPVEAGYYVVHFRPMTRCSAVVISINAAGRPSLEFPAGPASGARLFDAETTHVLPQQNIALKQQADGAEQVEFQPGFFVPIGAVELTVLLGLRAEPPGTDLLSSLESQVLELLQAASDQRPQLSGPSKTLRLWLEDRGFRVFEQRIVEKKP